MYLNPKKSNVVSVSDELSDLKKNTPGPFLKSKRIINISEEFGSILKKFEKNFKTPCINFVQLTEKSTEKIKRKPAVVYKQVKINNIFTDRKKSNPKQRRSI
jgi:hypothetical protein